MHSDSEVARCHNLARTTIYLSERSCARSSAWCRLHRDGPLRWRLVESALTNTRDSISFCGQVESRTTIAGLQSKLSRNRCKDRAKCSANTTGTHHVSEFLWS